MDAEDERNPKREEWYLRECLEERNQLELRLYEAKEVEAIEDMRSWVVIKVDC